MRLSVIVVNLNGAPFVFDCLSGLERQSFKDFEVILVDNGSEREELIEIKKRFSWVRIIELGENKGFAFACNIGWKESRGEEIVVLNNDAVPEDNWLEEMVRCLDSDPRIGGVAPLVLNKETSAIESAGIFPARNGLVYLFKPREEKEQEVFGVCGVAGLYRGRMLRELGFYPEDFFIYYEDADLAYRARRAGWGVVFCPQAKVWHLGSKTTASMAIKTYYLARNRLRTIVRNWDAHLILKYLPWILSYEMMSLAGALIKGEKGAIKARIDFLKLLPSDLKTRRKILSSTSRDFRLENWLEKDYPSWLELWEKRR